MAEEGTRTRSKRERREARRRAGRRRRLRARLRSGALVAVLLGVLGLWQFDRWGPEEVLQAEVIDIRVWSHRGNDGRNHTHQRATLEIEGLVRATVERADDLERGQVVPVRVRRGRLTGRPRFVGLEEAPAQERSAEGTEPLEELD